MNYMDSGYFKIFKSFFSENDEILFLWVVTVHTLEPVLLKIFLLNILHCVAKTRYQKANPSRCQQLQKQL